MLELAFRKRLGAYTLDIALRADNEAIALLGASGAGKSMALKCIAGVEKPDSGRIVLDGRVLFDAQRGIDLPPQARKVGLLFQHYALFPTMTVQQNIVCGLRHLPKLIRRHRADELMRRFHLDELRHQLPASLSGGQQQRVALARMLGSEPQLLLLDEPFSALDSFLRWELEQIVAEVITAHEGTTLFVSHNRDEAYRLCDRIAVIERGEIEVCKAKSALFAQPETRAAARILGCENIADAQWLGEDAVTIPAWGIALRVRRKPRAAAIGLPAQAIRMVQGENAFCARIERIIPCPDHVRLVVRPPRAEESLLCLVDKTTAPLPSPGEMITLSVPSASILQLN